MNYSGNVRDRQWGRALLMALALHGALMGCVPKARQLTVKEAAIPIVPADTQVTAALEKECKAVGTARNTPTAEDQSLRATIRSLSGELECSPNLSSSDDIRRCAGEHQAQVVQIAGWETKTTDRRLLLAALRIGNAWAGGVAQQVGSTSMATTTALNDLELEREAEHAVQTRVTSLDLRFWKCPASRAEPASGELLWQRHGHRLELLKEGQVVIDNQDFTELPPLVSAHAPAASYAAQAAERERAAKRKAYAVVPLAALALAGDVVTVVGVLKRDPWLIGGGAGGALIFTSATVGVGVSAGKAHLTATTAGMNAVDLYNDFVRRRPGGQKGRAVSVP